ncbi:hypothetical protein M9H77_27250 [Catharanthus roseus]|uniref:Uncharacterized protein n=1 Tax=Catharanthus roseus TaxID=4058 RepID=A0ACC0AEP3_CATRO|nr:hypothetical protein M9H77_27250 [Catharanthus roseus]
MDCDQRKKRKFDGVERRIAEDEEEEEEEEESEEAKMEKFYELIRRSKDIRARLNLKINGGEKSKKLANESNNRGGGAWNPTFELEDFMEDGFCVNNVRAAACRPATTNNVRMQVAVAGAGGGSNSKSEEGDHPGRRREEGEGDGDGDGLDLNLSL